MSMLGSTGDSVMTTTAQTIARTVRPDIRAAAAYPVPDATGFIKLDAMESPYELPARIRADIARALAETPLARYPGADHAADAALRDLIRQAFGVPAEAGLLFGNGSDEIIHLIIQACCEPGDTVLAPAPSFVVFEMAARLGHARFESVPLTPDFGLDLPAMLAAIAKHRPKVIFLALPNNPTGGLWPEAEINAILQAAPGLVVLDEAYQPYSRHTWMPQAAALPNAVVMRTVSKIGLAGLRFGYLAGPPAWIAEIDKPRPPYNIDVLTLAALRAILPHKAALDEYAARVRADRAALAQGLSALPGARSYDSEANFVLTRFSGKMGANDIYLGLKARNILVKNVSSAHPLLAGCLRVTVGAPAENAAVLAALQNLLAA
jgi:histidinol-phosphate aminotransferase